MNFLDKKLTLLTYAQGEVDKLDVAIDHTQPQIKMFTTTLYSILRDVLSAVETESELADFIETTLWQAIKPVLDIDGVFNKEKMEMNWEEVEARKLDHFQADLIINWLKGLFGAME